ncbi:hypothetical protein BS78_06G098000 [Paspalum vaginatum]|nr:hypothetical protein BS78_06G098000 [Paspalum vaginatum]
MDLERHSLDPRDVRSATEGMLGFISWTYGENRMKNVYFHGWNGCGAAAVLRSLAQELRSIKAKKDPPAELCFDGVIYIDCSAWRSRREMQRKISEELQLGHETMAMFDKQDQDDDFSGVDHSSRDLIPSVTQEIAKIVTFRKFIMFFLNGGEDEIDVSRFGFPAFPGYGNMLIWTFERRPLDIMSPSKTEEMLGKLRYAYVFIDCSDYSQKQEFSSSEFRAMLHQVAASIVAHHPCTRSIDQMMATDCCLYELFLQHSFHRTTGSNWAAHASNYWMCDGIIEGDGAREISDTLHQEISWECDDASLVGYMFQSLMKDPEAPFMVVKDDDIVYENRPACRWISIISRNLTLHEDMQTMLERATSLFLTLEKSDDNLQGLPNGFLKHCSNFGVLILYQCAFSFVSPPFLQCHRLRFLGLDHCTHDNTSEEEKNIYWTCLQNLWVLDLRYTEWDDILSAEKMDIMVNLRELNIEGFMCWRVTTSLHGRLPCLRRLRIIKPRHKGDASIDTCNTFMDNKIIELEILDLSGNRDMDNLPIICSSSARRCEMLILDGCDGLENVVVSDGFLCSLRFFSFDGYGPAARWMPSFKLHIQNSMVERPINADERVIKTSKISLQGCTQLDSLFVRGLPNLVELDLSGSAIKVLDLETMVADVPKLKRIFLLGCEHLCSIKCGTFLSDKRELMVCIDTRPKRVHGFARPSFGQPKYFILQLHAILADARLARSLCHVTMEYPNEDAYFNICITSSTKYGGCVHTEATDTELIGHSDQQRQRRILVDRYGDVFSKIGTTPMQVFPQPHQQLDHHVEIGDGSRSLESEMAESFGDPNLGSLISMRMESVHMHDTSTNACMPGRYWGHLRRIRVERCPNLDTVFPPRTLAANELQTIWVSDLRKARCIWSKGRNRLEFGSFRSLQHLHLRCCSRLNFVLPVWVVASFPSLETIHIIHCGDLKHVFVLDEEYPKEIAVHGVPFPKLTAIHLHDLPKLQQIMCEEVKMLAPALETIRIRGCFGLRRLPALTAAREAGAIKKPVVEMEKDVWDALEWDGLAAGHHPDLFEPPVHARYYRRSRLLRGTVLR